MCSVILHKMDIYEWLIEGKNRLINKGKIHVNKCLIKKKKLIP